MSETCETCRYWTANIYNGIIMSDGRCRRRAPVHRFPETYANDWCGEHQSSHQEKGSTSPHAESARFSA